MAKKATTTTDIIEAATQAAATEPVPDEVVPNPAVQVTPVASTPRSLAQTVRQADSVMRKQEQIIHQKLANQKKVSVTIAPQYRPYFGDVMSVFLAGLAVYVPVNGRAYMIPEDFAAVVQERLARVNAHLLKCERMSNIQANVESYAGELKLY